MPRPGSRRDRRSRSRPRPTIISISAENHRLVFDGKHAPSRERATRLCGLIEARLDLPAGTRGSLISMGWMGEEKPRHAVPISTRPGALSRLQRDPQIDPQSVALEFDPRLSTEPMAHFALDQAQSEARPR